MAAKHPQKLLKDAVELHRQGQLDAAAEHYRALLRRHPAHREALCNLGSIVLRQGDHREAAMLLGKAIAAGAAEPAVFYNNGLALQESGELDAAIASYERAIALQPGLARAHYNRANALLASGKHGAAIAGYEAALAIDPATAEAWGNRGEALLGARQWAAARESFERAIALKPGLAKAHAGLGAALLSLRDPGAAANSLRDAVRQDPLDTRALCNLGTALVESGHHDAAIPFYERALALRPDYPFLRGQLLLTRLRVSDWSGFEEQRSRIRSAIASGVPVSPPFAVFALEDSTALQCAAARLWADTWFPQDEGLGHFRERQPGHKIRVGYFSADFHAHATMYLMAQLFEVHDRSRFDLYAFSFGPNTHDDMRQRVSRCFTRFIDVGSMGDRDIARLARDIDIDIAIDLKGYTTDARPGIFSCRAAPVQASYLGYPGSTGSVCIDYLIADHTVITAEAERHYPERIAFLPECYQVNDGARAPARRHFTRAELGLPESGVVLCSFNNNYKITPAMFDLWCRILSGSEDTCLWLLASGEAAEANLLREALARGVDAGRLVFAGKMPHEDHLARLRVADLFLDTFPCNAHTTASDALWAGLPVLTLAGESFASRVAASLLQAVDLPDLITVSPQDYERTAMELISDMSRLHALRAHLERKRDECALFDTAHFARGFEAALTQMYERHRGSGPQRSAAAE